MFEFYVEAKNVDGDIGQEFGMHESGAWYRSCKLTARNDRLYHADQKLNGNNARATRQNPNGNRRGLECPEERDYYPYWNPSMWIDIGVVVSNDEWCDYYKAHSQNVEAKYICVKGADVINSGFGEGNGQQAPISQE